MSQTCKQDPSLRFFRFRNPFKILFNKSNNVQLSPKLLSLLNNFETNLTVSIRKLIPKVKDDVVSVSWMVQAMESLCEAHKSIRTLVKDLELSVSDLEENLIYIYSDVSLKLLELCNAFTSELDRLNHGNLLLKFAFSKLETNELQLSYIDSWNQHMVSKNPRIENCGAVLSRLVESTMMDHHHLLSKKAKKKRSVKAKVLLRALYGVKVKTLYIFSVFAAAFSGSSKNLFYLTVPKEMEELLPWAQAFMELQNEVNPEIKNILLSDRFTVVKDLEAVETSVKKLNTAVQEGSIPILLLEELKKSVIELSERFDLVSNETRCFSKIVISARDALFESLWTRYAEELGVTLPMMMIKSVKTT